MVSSREKKIKRVKYLESRERRQAARRERRNERRRQRRALQRLLNNDFDIDLTGSATRYNFDFRY